MEITIVADIISDEVLYQQVRGGNMASFDILYSRYESRLLHFIRSTIHNVEEAEEIFHETFMGVLRSREVQFDRGSFKTWLFQIARNICLNRLRSQSRKFKTLGQVFHENKDEKLETPEDALENKRLLEVFSAAVSALSAPLLEMYHLRTSGMTYDEISRVLDLPLGTVETRMHELILQLRKETKIWTAT